MNWAIRRFICSQNYRIMIYENNSGRFFFCNFKRALNLIALLCMELYEKEY